MATAKKPAETKSAAKAAPAKSPKAKEGAKTAKKK